jgi:chromosome segregation ATPase
MFGGDIGLLIDGVVSILLVTVIVYAVQLNRNLAALKANKVELEQLIASFTESTNRAEASVGRLKSSATETAQALQSNVTRAQELRDDLTFMTERANEIADRLESAISDSRSENSTRGAQPHGAQANQAPGGRRRGGASDDASGDGDDDEREKSKSELLRALQGMR